MIKSKWSRGELTFMEKCPACEHIIDYSPVYKRFDDEHLMLDEWNIYNCNYCQSFFVNPRPSENSLPELYQDYLTHRSIEPESIFVSSSIFWKLVRGYLSKRLGIQFDKKQLNIGYALFMLIPPLRYKLDRFGRNLIHTKFSKRGRLLDLGCGAGDFLSLAMQMGWDTYGCDFDPTIIKNCKDKGLNVRLGGLNAFSNEEKFDVITMNQVIEHMIQPQQVIKECHAALNSNGCLWIGTPNPQANGAKVFGKNWAGLHPPYHLCIPSQTELVRWFHEAGFHDIQILHRGPHAKFNWSESIKRYTDSKEHKAKILHTSPIRLVADLINIFTPKYGEETIIIGYKKD